MVQSGDGLAGTSQKKVEPRVLWTIWGAMLLSVLLYVGIGYLVFRGPSLKYGTMDHHSLAKLRLVLYLISLIMAVGSIFLGRKSRPRVDYNKIQETIERLQGSKSQSQSTFLLLLISWGLAEGIAIYGLVLFLLGKRMPDLIGFAIVGVLLIIINRPKTGTSSPYTKSEDNMTLS